MIAARQFVVTRFKANRASQGAAERDKERHEGTKEGSIVTWRPNGQQLKSNDRRRREPPLYTASLRRFVPSTVGVAFSRSHLSLEATDLGVLLLDGDAKALDRDGLLHEDRLVRVHAQLQGLRLLTDLGDILGDG